MTTEQNMAPSLSPEQWAGLARLGGMINGAESFLGSPASSAVLGMALRLGEWNERYELETSIEELLSSVYALRRAGVLQWVTDNAEFLRDNVELIRGFVPQILDVVRDIPWATLVQAMQTLGDVMPKVQAFQEFLQTGAGNDLVAQLKKLGDLWEETRADESIVAALRVLRQLQEDGNLQRVADLSRQIGLLAETIPLESLLGQLMQEQEKGPLMTSLGTLLHSGKAMAKALEDAAEHEAQGKAGGISGLYHMLKDPDVQRGMRVVAVLPVYLQKAGVLPRNAAA
ncbi:DUF1641 domain-containing protein [Acidithiobacillus sp. CV18-2]|uniref:DUF1641 domain-containing protein n=1 Tax=Igneacidithiobacillus copahuensis TaxID=2724909 RepID=A0AAE3CK91_9PROT|nr:DUF1641 domain-containing protein [Igneacidithiobacillus copahuensis]MBU2753517.1 DUF1641 domain-containing protein [Acidithiobacillus sp. CV18-3]MBU2757135.1 DUF1641 domain-containing protein [Acidithiobacillus sp. BN09-2]MBU2776011.1 DUF1641 domain-containing protein [Acidithiobacillus sp. CV18-2]MBU2795902.1 DUF1641 domain-containing protein [Acidithiobacillus sp. VAN18-2]MBU2800312.1 DUF1641 domain-containing protein [Acidithiobacillus sp. VAN18-4]UTV79841.1 DUF1641 domain-containing p